MITSTEIFISCGQLNKIKDTSFLNLPPVPSNKIYSVQHIQKLNQNRTEI